AKLTVEVVRISGNLALAQDNLLEKQAVLSRRLVDIYKRGPLYSFQVLLTAESFGDLLSRYKYLYLTSRQDRALVAEVQELRDRVQKQREEILQVRSEFSHRRSEREDELNHYGRLADETSRRLANVRRSTRSTEQRLSALEEDEARLNDLLAALERARREEAAREGRTAAPGSGTLTTADLGKLDWPVDGTIVYGFGRQRLPSGAIIRRNGIGIGAAPGTPVRAVEAGRVELLQRLNTYGLTIVVEHGNGYRSLYMHLGEARVALGAGVTRGQIIGTVGGETSDEGPHLYFEIRGENGIALDPADWLRRRR
ncbi:MAG: murein hydrolase activator EnvC, partial [Gemmatimonadales bacterium]